MATSTDPEHFFQTTSSLEASTRKADKSKNTLGDPIHVSSKILAVILDPAHYPDNAVYIAESAGIVRRVSLETGSKDQIFRSPASTAPLTSLALIPPDSASPETIFAGSWDKSIHSWSLATRAPGKRLVGGHTDFVKCLKACQSRHGKSILLSGGADANIVLWDPETGARLQILRTGHTRGILDLAIDPNTYLGPFLPDEPENGHLLETEGAASPAPIHIFSASSDRSIRRFSLSSSLALAETHPHDPLLPHETSINALTFSRALDLWTASADGTAKCLSRARGWAPDTILQHGDYVRAAVIDEDQGWVITAGRSEAVKIWDLDSGELVWAYEGHWDEITGLVLVRGRREVVSVGIDGTVRRWGVGREGVLAAKIKAKEEEGRRARGEEIVPEADNGLIEGGENVLTAEEERELEELMMDED